MHRADYCLNHFKFVYFDLDIEFFSSSFRLVWKWETAIQGGGKEFGLSDLFSNILHIIYCVYMFECL